MNFSDYLIKSGNFEFPLNLINIQSYTCTPDQRQDVDSYRDLNQDLHRNVADHYKSVIKFKLRANLRESELRPFIDGLQSKFTNKKERKLPLKYWNTDKGNYSSGDFYWVQPNYTIKNVIPQIHEIVYDAMDMEFIEY